MRAAGIIPIITLLDPFTITSGGPTQVAMSVTRAAGKKPIITVGQPGGRIGPPTCGTTPVTMGQVCMSDTRAAGGIVPPNALLRFPDRFVQIRERNFARARVDSIHASKTFLVECPFGGGIAIGEDHAIRLARDRLVLRVNQLDLNPMLGLVRIVLAALLRLMRSELDRSVFARTCLHLLLS